MNERPSSDLCLQCGICCDGTLFSTIPLSPEEANTLVTRGFELSRRSNGRTVLSLGCQALEGCRCTQYEARPGACRAFRCDLCRGVEAGSLQLEEALGVIEEAKRLRLKAIDRELEAFLERHFHRLAG